ncbi:hypothetical protein VIGAN_02135600 [Vigna angularis var. angularis]|uniref:Uncharacterized protein n=1 Tax=Vigna angularis var. angularis TaxID=157739 RepID=A0A0S3RD76_PHAAN|nr:hypothetical protein VIGAN_02135600 [Vigna angularis var. angularis]
MTWKVYQNMQIVIQSDVSHCHNILPYKEMSVKSKRKCITIKLKSEIKDKISLYLIFYLNSIFLNSNPILFQSRLES